VIARVVVATALALLALAGCNKTWAPVEDRSAVRGGYAATPDGSYRVRRGDSLHAIAFNFGLDWRDIARWNGIQAPYVIHPDQVLRLGPAPEPSRSVTTTAARPYPSSSDRAVSRDVAVEPAPPAPEPSKPAPAVVQPPRSQVPASQQSTPEPTAEPTPTAKPPVAVGQADPKAWLWPAEGRILSRFRANDPSRNGVEIGGEEGRAVQAAAAGEVVYSGNGLIGYGELIIIKHSDRMLSAYGHNRKRLVAEGQVVAAGEKIARAQPPLAPFRNPARRNAAGSAELPPRALAEFRVNALICVKYLRRTPGYVLFLIFSPEKLIIKIKVPASAERTSGLTDHKRRRARGAGDARGSARSKGRLRCF